MTRIQTPDDEVPSDVPSEPTGLGVGASATFAEYFAENRRLLSVMASRIAGSVLDPDDLLASAVAAMLERWEDGAGPTQHPTAYLIASMRNRVRDELRSPRSRLVSWTAVDEPTTAMDTSAIEMYREHRLLRQALDYLPDAQRRVLVATVVEDRKPRDLVAELDRPAAAIHSLGQRARANLRLGVIRAILDQCPNPACSKDAARTARAIDSADDLELCGFACASCLGRWRALNAAYHTPAAQAA